MSNRIGAVAAWSLRAPNGTSREIIVTFGVTTVPALATPGRARPIQRMRSSFFITSRTAAPCPSPASPSSAETLSEYNPYTHEEGDFARVLHRRCAGSPGGGFDAQRP